LTHNDARERVRSNCTIQLRFHLDVTGWFRGTEPVALLPSIASAVWGERILKIRYRHGQGANDVNLAPLGPVLKAGVWYLVAQRRGALRTYRAANILTAEILEESFTRPADFDMAAYWSRASREYELGNYRGEAVLRLSARGRSR
jgi:predicted DNA-binding transcriptional regulator YafY